MPAPHHSIFRSSLSDDLTDWNSGLCVCPLSVRTYVHKQFFWFRSNLVYGRPRPICTSLWLWPDPSSRSRSLSFWSSENCTFLGLSFPPFWHWAQNWWLIILVWDLVYSLSQPDFLISFSVSYHVISNFADCRHYRTFIGLYFRIAWCYSHMVGYAGSPIRIVHADMTLTRSKGKVKVMRRWLQPRSGAFSQARCSSWRSASSVQALFKALTLLALLNQWTLLTNSL